jgi:ATP-dependent RNA helicase DeaD
VLVAGELDSYRVIVESLAEEYDVLDVAAAAVKLADSADDRDATADEDIPNAAIPRRDERPDREPRGRAVGKAAKGRPVREEKWARDEKPRRAKPDTRRRDTGDVTRVYIALGRKAGVRPGDLVGAIANEAGSTHATLARSKSPIGSRWSKYLSRRRTRSFARSAPRPFAESA